MDRRFSGGIARRQQGAALLVIMLVVFLAATSWVLSRANAVALRTEKEARTTAALALAKEALLGRAAADKNRPGSLPCPDISPGEGTGIAPLFFIAECPDERYIGRLPWHSLDIPNAIDGDGNRLWYVLSRNLRDNASAQPINVTTPLTLALDGQGNIAAIIFSAGSPLVAQTERPNNVVSNYLDGGNADADMAYVSGPPSNTFNDSAIAITRDELFRAVVMRVLAEIRGPDPNAALPHYGLRNYRKGNSVFPWADVDNDGVQDVGSMSGTIPYGELGLPIGPPPNPDSLAWLKDNSWLPLVNYRRLNSDAAQISIGNVSITVFPCPSTPCP
ncbi:hypothetical protein [Propionivibrio soli]|uniref:hypothetical protein n=1 Tax=Propionivibrio soli TaxID=2976531 RepID=UPI0021E7F0EF|nr:hypothetical protein [Propionivibrio soli]